MLSRQIFRCPPSQQEQGDSRDLAGEKQKLHSNHRQAGTSVLEVPCLLMGLAKAWGCLRFHSSVVVIAGTWSRKVNKNGGLAVCVVSSEGI